MSTFIFTDGHEGQQPGHCSLKCMKLHSVYSLLLFGRRSGRASEGVEMQERKGRRMQVTDEQIDTSTIEVGRLSSADVEELGESVLGGAVRRRLKEGEGSVGVWSASNPIAAFQDSI